MIRSGHPGHGPREPVLRAPARTPGSVRRTSTVDVVGARRMDGSVEIVGAARDLLTGSDGASRLASARVLVDRSGPRPRVAGIDVAPAVPGATELVGAPAQGGFRAALRAALPVEVAAATPLHLVLDDLPGVLIASGYAWAVEPPPDAGPLRRTPPADVCSGWRSDGTMMLAIRRDGALPPMAGPAAPPLGAGDPDGWHETRVLDPGEVRRARRIDVRADGGALLVDAMFRDSYRDTDGDESVVHEYRLDARVDRATLRILTLDAEPRVLPWVECPAAAASGSRLVGRDVREVRALVGGTFAGISTCTHLNDLLRSLGDVAPLAAALAG
jgi:Protein of unknown function (DUF2889)